MAKTMNTEQTEQHMIQQSRFACISSGSKLKSFSMRFFFRLFSRIYFIHCLSFFVRIAVTLLHCSSLFLSFALVHTHTHIYSAIVIFQTSSKEEKWKCEQISHSRCIDLNSIAKICCKKKIYALFIFAFLFPCARLCLCQRARGCASITLSLLCRCQ